MRSNATRSHMQSLPLKSKEITYGYAVIQLQTNFLSTLTISYLIKSIK